MEKHFPALSAFVIEQYGLSYSIAGDTRIEKDLGINGDDAVEFILAYGNKFNADVSEFMLADYFDGEGWVIDKPRMTKELTINDLKKRIIAGKLNEEIITPS